MAPPAGANARQLDVMGNCHRRYHRHLCLSLDVEPARHGHTTGTNVQSLTYAADGSITDDTRDPSNDYG
ncbi:MAG: hypothetical protein JSR60_20530, partial [Proteobacteria bacterium]|nr:hypothetical protein [Pseudomonadota bacterium]